jgi:hypothetical protein
VTRKRTDRTEYVNESRRRWKQYNEAVDALELDFDSRTHLDNVVADLVSDEIDDAFRQAVIGTHPPDGEPKVVPLSIG